MIEIFAAVVVPALVLLAISWRAGSVDFRSAVARTFVPLTLVWFAPYWLTGRSPAPLPYLFTHVVPWSQTGFAERWILPLFAVQNVLLSDVVLQFLPWREIVTAAWLHGQLPLLNPFAGAGSPLWANPQAAVLAPTTILGLPFSTFAWPLFAATVKVLTALTGTYLFLREEGRSDAAARFGAVAYAFCGFAFAFMLFPLTNVTTLLPWMLLAIRRASAGAWRGVVFAAIVTFLLLIAGHPESVLHTALIAVPYGIARARTRRGFVMLAWAAVIGLLLAAPLVIPFARIVGSTERAAREGSFFNAPKLTVPNALPFVFAAHFEYSAIRDDGGNFNEMATQYAGFATFVLAIAAAVVSPRRQRFWIVLFIVLTVTAFDIVPLGVPVLHGRIRFVLAFIAAVLGAAGFDLLREHLAVVRRTAALSLAVVIGAAVFFWSTYVRVHVAPIVVAAVLMASIGALILASGRTRWLTLALFADLAVLGMTSHPPSDRTLAFPRRPVLDFLAKQRQPFRIVGIDSAMFPNTSAFFGIEDIRVHDPVAFEPYAAALEKGGYDRSRYFEVFRRLPSHALADRLGVRFVVAGPDARGALPVVYRGKDAVVYVNPSARSLFTTMRPGAAVAVNRYGAGRAELSISSGDADVVRSGIAALPGWTLKRNGSPWPLRGGDGLLEWSVPAGRSDFVLDYWPAGLTAGLVLSAFGIMALLHAVWLSAITRSSSASAG